jgi:hypothetical protein
MKQVGLLYGVLLLTCSSASQAFELSGNIAIQDRVFLDDPLEPGQHNNYASFSVEPELYHSWDKDTQSLTITPFYRYDQHDDERTHADIRELSWQKVFDNWELTAGISKVYWGVTETQHLVDIINQTDQVENIDGEDKLGQPMIQFSTERDWGVLDFFILPGFRERTFSGVEGRPRPILPANFDSEAATYESSDKNHHIDYAFRWFSTYDELELGLSHFSGTSREPEIRFNGISLAPYYDLINQTGLDLQAFIEDWTWKLELISRENSTERFTALTAGFEYTIVGIYDSDADLGIVIEYLFDDRNQLASTPFQNDLTTAFRLALNDVQSSELLLGITTDLDNQIVAAFVEGSRRIGESFKVELEIRTFNNTSPTRPLHSFRQDNFIQAELAWYF